MHKIISLAVALMPITNAFSADAPGTVYVQNADEKSAITAICDAPVANQMHCRFTQMMISKPDEAKAEERIAKSLSDMLKAPDTEFKDCDKFENFLTALETGKPPPDVSDMKTFQKGLAKLQPEAKADTVRLMKAFVGFCKKRDAAGAEAIARASEQLEGTTCKISNWTFDKTFALNYSTKRWQSTVQTTDSCGTIEYAEFAKPDDPKANYFWDYTAKSIVTNPTGQNIIGEACSATDQSEHRYTWQTGKFYANCRYVEISP